jgi:hypothetical protein
MSSFQFITDSPIFHKAMHKVFSIFQKIGIDVLPRSFYSSIPNIAHLKTSREWRKKRNLAYLPGSDMRKQVETLSNWSLPFCEEQKNLFQTIINEVGYVGYGPIESDILYCFIRANKPKKIIQIGAGFTTEVILKAAALSDYQPQVLCIDPFPSQHLLRLAALGKIELLKIRAQELSKDFFDQLGAGDLLFIDSTHTVAIDSEVNTIILEVLPRLAKGCHVHFHDIYIPYDYNPHILNSIFFWQESVLLSAFLTSNESCKINVCSSQMHYEAPEELKKIFKHYNPANLEDGLAVEPLYVTHFPSSMYLIKH